METFQKTLSHTHDWALDRIEVLSTKSIHDRDLDLFQDSNAIAQEFYEWVNPETVSYTHLTLPTNREV